MKFNKSFEGNDFNEYAEYLLKIKNKIPKKLFDFISDPERHDLGDKSLHDSRITKIQYEFVSEDKYKMSLLLLGKNRTFEIRFKNISQLNIKLTNYGDIYKDLITYEVGTEKDTLENEKIVFRAKFPFEEGKLEIYSEKIEIEENVLQHRV